MGTRITLIDEAGLAVGPIGHPTPDGAQWPGLNTDAVITGVEVAVGPNRTVLTLGSAWKVPAGAPVRVRLDVAVLGLAGVRVG